jgi:signal transduction histidine kinase
VTSWSHWRRGRFWIDIVLAIAVGVAAFAAAAAASTAARSHLPALLLGLLLLLAVLAIARYAGILYALPVGVVTIEAFDWYFLPPLRGLDADTVLELAVILGAAVIVGAVATQTARRAAGSERARGVLADEQAALRRVATLVARQPSPAEVFAAVTQEAATLMRLSNAYLIAYRPGPIGAVAGAWNPKGPPAPAGTAVAVEGDNIMGRVFRTERPARIDDYDDAGGAAADIARSMGVRAAVGVPVLAGGRLWGVLMVGSSRPGPLPAETESRLGAFTELVTTAIANAEARAELGRIAAGQAALGRVATLVAEAVPPAEVFAAVAAEVGAQFGVPMVGLFRYEREGMATVIAGAGNLSRYLGRPWPCPAGDPGVVASLQRTGQPCRVDDYSQITSAISGPARELGIGRAAGVPVIVSGRVWGAAVVAAGHENPQLPADTLDRLAAFTELLATAIANSDARAEIERLAQEQAALRRVATLVARGADTGDVFAAVAREVAEVMQLPVAAVQRYEDGEIMTVLAAWSDRPHPYQPGTSSPFHAAGLAGRVRRTGHAGRVEDYSHRRGAFAAMAREVGLHSVAGAPITVDGAVWGLVTIASTDGPLPEQAEDRLAEFTELVGTAIANTQSRAELSASRARIVAAADQTRRRLERDLHDGIQQRLVSLALKARTIESMTPRPAAEIQDELSLLARGLGTALDELREISRGIHPAVLSEAGLGPALKALARRSGVPVELDLNLGQGHGDQLDVAAYYITSEALTNAAKHARASVIEVHADTRDGALTLLIRDDGIGGADSSRGTGIVGLKDRVEALGGTISLRSPAGHGTTLHVRLPGAPATPPSMTLQPLAWRASRRLGRPDRASACASIARLLGRPVVDDPQDRIGRQLRLRHEPRGGAVSDQVCEVGLRMGRYQYHRRCAAAAITG